MAIDVICGAVVHAGCVDIRRSFTLVQGISLYVTKSVLVSLGPLPEPLFTSNLVDWVY